MAYSQRLILYFPLATIRVTGGLKVLETYKAFAKAESYFSELLKADGKDIPSVRIVLNAREGNVATRRSANVVPMASPA
ncbi:MAG: hypothetical protein WB586_04800 [Chthoniobacterales bacterium]